MTIAVEDAKPTRQERVDAFRKRTASSITAKRRARDAGENARG